METNKPYGYELILDLHKCNSSKFNRKSLREFFTKLCEEIDMEPADLHFWDYEGYPEEKELAPPHIMGTSAVQFILTSTIVVHTLDLLEAVYVNIFSCKEFDRASAETLVKSWFESQESTSRFIERV